MFICPIYIRVFLTEYFFNFKNKIKSSKQIKIERKKE